MERSKIRPKRTVSKENQWPALASLSEGEIAFLTSRTRDEFWNMEYENRFSKHVHGGLFSPASIRGRELWEKFWPLIAGAWVKKHPGTRPAAFWFHATPDRDSADYYDLKARAAWPKSKPAAYLEKHGLLQPGERA